MIRGATRLAALCAAALTAAAAAPAQNLLANPDFDTDASSGGWGADVEWILGEWSADDAFGEAGSGSVLVRNVRDSAGSNGWFQCVAASEGLVLDASVWTRSEPSQTNSNGASLEVWFFASEGCSFAPPGLIESFFTDFAAPADWTRLALRGLVAPAATQSIRFDLRVEKASGDPEPATALFDAAYLPEPSAVATAAAALFALAALRRR